MICATESTVTRVCPPALASARVGRRAVAIILLLSELALAREVRVSVDAGRSLGTLRRSERYLNNSLRMAPPPGLAARVVREFGKPAIMRCWLPLDDMWDYRTGEYRFNFRVGEDYYRDDAIKFKYDRDAVNPTNVNYEDYLEEFSRHSDALLLNIRRYEREVVGGVISLAKWKEVVKTGVRHYRSRCPNLRYIEILNETAHKEFGGLTPEQDFQFYKAGYELVNELNAELALDPPLLVGGNASASGPYGMLRLLELFTKEPDVRKRLDFVSFHKYFRQEAESLNVLAEWRGKIVDRLGRSGLSAETPIFIDETGYTVGYAREKTDLNLNRTHAVAMTACLQQVRHWDRVFIFPWVLYHTPTQRALVQFDERLRLTPFGAAVKMLTLHKNEEVEAKAPALDQTGRGVGVLASADASGLAIQLWNFSKEPAHATVAIQSLPGSLRGRDVLLRTYLIDEHHSNCFADERSDPGLELVRESVQPVETLKSLEIRLEPFALCLWTVGNPEPARSVP